MNETTKLATFQGTNYTRRSLIMLLQHFYCLILEKNEQTELQTNMSNDFYLELRLEMEFNCPPIPTRKVVR